MANISLLKPPDPFSCSICQEPPYNTKAGEGCKNCPAFKDTHYLPYSTGDTIPDLIVLGDVPDVPKMAYINGIRQWRNPHHDSFEEDGSKVIKLGIKKVKEENAQFNGLSVRYLYAIKCATTSVKKSIITSCNINLKNDFFKIIDNHTKLKIETNMVILACGTHSLNALGISVRSENDAMGRVFEIKFMGYNFSVVFTRSISAWAASSGKFSSLKADIVRAFNLIKQDSVKVKPRVEIEKQYVYPETIEQVSNIVDEIINYSGDKSGDPKKWAISLDTETNTLYPYKDGLQVTALSSAWNEGLATTIPLWHKETPYNPDEAWTHVLRLLKAGKPSIWFNGKYDYKVLWKLGLPFSFTANTQWDGLLAEHVLEEDKKGQYGLKFLVKQFFPELAGYEDKLHDLLEKTDHSYDEKKKNKIVEIPELIKSALEDLKLKPTFSIKRLEKTLATLDANDPDARLMRLVINAKKNGEFKTAEQVSKEKVDKGGFENIPLKELMFYAAVDADSTRRTAILQIKRIVKEQNEINNKRNKIIKKLGSLPPSMQKFKVNIICQDPNPCKTLVVRDYLPRQHELAKIEYRGVRINRDYLDEGTKQLQNTILINEQKIYELCGETIKINSSKQLGKFIFKSGIGYIHPDPELAQEMADKYPEEVIYKNGRIMYKAPRYTATGAEQTNEAALKFLVAKYKCPLANLLLSYRKAFKAKNSFFVNIEKLSREDGYIHPNYNLNGTATGRLSSSSGVKKIGFNNQNIIKGLIGALKDTRGNLIRDENGIALFEGVSCKKLFIPDDDSYAFFNADAKGAEVSVFAAFSGDAQLIDALIKGMDAHSFFGSKCLDPNVVAAGLTGDARKLALSKAGIDDDHAWTYEDFLLGKDDLLPDKAYGKRLKALRDNIKRLVFGLLYGAGVRKIAEIAGIDLALAENIHKLLFSMFPTIPNFIEQTKWELRTFDFVETYDGRRRRFSLGENAPHSLKARAERQAVNFKIQGQNSDMVMKTLVWFSEILERDFGGRLLLTVHDSLGFQVPKKYVSQIPEVIYEVGTKRIAKEHPWMPVPYRWDVECGSSYGDVTSVKKYLEKLPKQLEPELDGYTEEEKYDEIRRHYDEMDNRK